MPETLAHYGTPRRSGRYPWGSGENPYQGHQSFRMEVQEMKKSGMTEKAIAEHFGISTTQLRARNAIAKNEKRKADEAMALRLKDKGYSNVAIGQRMGINESSVRALLDPAMKERSDILQSTAQALRDSVDKNGYIDVGAGVELWMGVKQTKLNTAVAMLQEEGYTVHYVKVKQLGTGNETTIKVLAPPGTPYSEVCKHAYDIKPGIKYTEDGGRTWQTLKPPSSVDSKRIKINYAEDGGIDKDGVIEIRRGVQDLYMGNSKYAQVRIAVDGTHYLKGMAMYADDLPSGVDIRFNTSKHKGTPLKSDDSSVESVLKRMKDDPTNPFGAQYKQVHQNGDPKKPLSALNLVNEEGSWDTWSKSLSSQFLSKQSSKLAKEQLSKGLKDKVKAFDEISSLTNPTLKKKLLLTLGDEADSAAVDLKAAALPRQRTQVILPLKSLKDNEIYAPNFKHGETVVLVRHPHGGIFEIPQLKVNNKNKEGNRLLRQAKDAVGITAKVAQKLSGADFDGDTVLVIPNNSGKIKIAPSLAKLKHFDPKESYPGYPGMKVMTKRQKGQEMGKISNLITDMTIKGANQDEIARAVRHSMVVIDAEKHKLNYKQSELDNGISALKAKYQGGANHGASTLISRAGAKVYLPQRKERRFSKGGPIDPATGRKMYEPTNSSFINKEGKLVINRTKSTRMAEALSAKELVSKEHTQIESIYADYADSMKRLGNRARKEAMKQKPIARSASAQRVYAKEVSSLKSKLNVALKNAPLERRAQLIANDIITKKKKANPDLDSEDLKKLKGQALTEARARAGAGKQQIHISTKEWNAIQAGAVSPSTLSRILDHADLDEVKKLATPKNKPLMSPSKVARANALLDSGHTQSEVAQVLGVSLSTLKSSLN